MHDIKKIINEIELRGFKVKNFLNLANGINSSIFQIESYQEKYLLKIYNSNKINTINRLDHEKKFLTFLKECKFRNVPRIIFCNAKDNWLLMSWIEGEKVNKVNYDLCVEYLGFLVGIQKFRGKADAKFLSPASDAFFQLKGHISSVNDRLFLLEKKQKELFYLKKDLVQIFENFLDKIKSEIHNLMVFQRDKNIDIDYILPEENRIISQSDVGFHNMLIGKNKVYFLDFEYAGWDDPGKLFSDLLLQPDNNVPIKYFKILDKYLKNYILKSNYHNDRLMFMLKLIRIKWSFIILNPIFRGEELSKNDFSNLLKIKINKSLLYLENSLLLIKTINQKLKS